MTDMTRDAAFGAAPADAQPVRSAFTGAVVARAAIVALILGSLLALANQGGAIFGAEAVELLPLVLVYLTPFVVVTISQLLGVRQALIERDRAPAGPARRESFLATTMGHGIPGRAAAVGLIVGSINSALVMALALAELGTLANLPWPLIGQAFGLPVLFGVLSQALAFRRAARPLDHRPAAQAAGAEA